MEVGHDDPRDEERRQEEKTLSEIIGEKFDSSKIKEVLEDGMNSSIDPSKPETVRPFLDRTINKFFKKDEVEEFGEGLGNTTSNIVDSVFSLLKDAMERSNKYKDRPYLVHLPMFFRAISLKETEYQEDALIVSSMMDGTDDILTLYDDPEFKASVLKVAVGLQRSYVDLMKIALTKLEAELFMMNEDADIDFLLRTLGEKIGKR